MVDPPHPTVTVLRPLVIHPVVIYALPWLLVCVLYSWHWSSLLLFNADAVLQVALTIVVPLLASWMYWSFFAEAAETPASGAFSQEIFETRARQMFVVWVLVTIVEIIVAKGVPILWLVTGVQKSYEDFGIKSVHGMMNSLLFACVTMFCVLGFITRKRKYFWYLAFGMVWGVVVVSRQVMMVILVQALIVMVQYRKINFAKLTFWTLLIGLLVILGFGALGDLRSPEFMYVAAVTPQYPDWLPSGFIWVYIYMATPLNNLIYTIQQTLPAYDLTFPATLAQFFPTIFRNMLFNESVTQGTLVSDVFNVSTAFVGPYQDFGLIGIFAFAWMTMGATTLSWRRRDVRNSLIYATFGMCAVTSIFFDHFLALPVIAQVPWFYLAVRKSKIAATAQLSLA